MVGLKVFLSSNLQQWLRCIIAAAMAFLVWPTPPVHGETSQESFNVGQFNRSVRPILANNCFTCHGPDANDRQAGLRLDTFEGSTAELESGLFAVVPGDAANSELIRRINSNDESERMPPEDSGRTLSDQEKEILRDWIIKGARYDKHWSLLPPIRSPLPEVEDTSWCRSPIDYFVIAKLKLKGLTPSPMVDRATLLRRVYFDLIGLPPTVEEVDAFLADTSQNAYETVVDRLLESPHYGERWGRHWLDVARYADSAGYEFDTKRDIWKYRDWVIHALNSDLPYDQFLTEQLAGDLLPDAALEQKIATGFNCNAMQQYGDVHDTTIDRVNTFGTTVLGLTLGCAQCHDHKFDPISQREYFQLYAFFDQSQDTTLDLSPPEVSASHSALAHQIAILKKELYIYQNGPDKDPIAWAAQLTSDEVRALSTELREAVLRLSADRSLEQLELLQQEHSRRCAAYLGNLRNHIEEWNKSLAEEQRNQMGSEAKLYFDTPMEQRPMGVPPSVLAKYWEQDVGRIKRSEVISHLEETIPTIESTMVMQERNAPPTRIFLRGDFRNLGSEVQPNTPSMLPPLRPEGRVDRLDLARWSVSRENPLTARVEVNRIWQALFGIGLVETSDNLGIQTPLPEYNQLLDWLAVEFMDGDWKLKHILRMIVTSATYRQSSQSRADLKSLDPQNRLFARQSRLRLEAETIRDVSLAVSGLLNPTIGGPSVFPYQPEGVMVGRADGSAWVESEGADRYRRGVYTHYWRLTPHPFLSLFDVPDAAKSCSRRTRSNTPVQALTLLNDRSFTEAAAALATRVQTDAPTDSETTQISWALKCCLSRNADPRELEILGDLLVTQRMQFEAEPARARSTINLKEDSSLDPKQIANSAAWYSVSRAILNLDEFITRE